MRKFSVPIAAAVLALAAACATVPAPPPGSIDVRTVMQQQTNPAVLAIWDVTNNAMDDEGGLDPAQLDAAKWQRIAEEAERLATSGHAMGDAVGYLAAAPGNTAVAPGELTMAEVQRLIDSDPTLFRQMSAALGAHGDRLAAAAKARDAEATEELVAELDGVCASCHARFWHPQ
jgi:cytochrome c556